MRQPRVNQPEASNWYELVGAGSKAVLCGGEEKVLNVLTEQAAHKKLVENQRNPPRVTVTFCCPNQDEHEVDVLVDPHKI